MTEVVIVVRDGRPSYATREHMVDSASIVLARFSRHMFKVAERRERIDAPLRRVCSSLRARGVRAEQLGSDPSSSGQTPVGETPVGETPVGVGSPEVPHWVRLPA